MMRCMKRNYRTKGFYYALFLGSDEMKQEKDIFEVYTGDRSGRYTEPKYMEANIAPKSYFYNGDTTVTQMFGTDFDYDRVIQVDWANEDAWKINEYSRLWVDVEPYKNGVLQPHDYIVKRINATHDNSALTIAIVRITRDETDYSG